MTTSYRHIGRSYPIHDAEQKARGSLFYGSDMKLPNMLHAKFLLSPIAHADIAAIDTREAEALPGVVKIFTHRNVPSKRYNRYRILPRQKMAPEDETLLTSRVRFVGDRIAVVVAKDVKTAKRALPLIRVEYKKLPPVINPLETPNASQPRIHESGNLLHRFAFETGREVAGKIEDFITESVVKTAKVHHAALEPHGCVADMQGEKLTLYAGCQGAFGIRTVVADLLEMEYSNVRVVKVPIGGSFGGRQEAIVEPITAFLAYDLKRPVKLTMDRYECIVSTMIRSATQTKIRSLFSKSGKIKSFRVDTLLDAGAYATSSVSNADAMKSKIPRLYRIPYYAFRSDIVYTNTPVGGGKRGWGAPEMITAAEIHMDKVAKQTGIDPVRLRIDNLVAPGDIDPVSRMSLGNARIKDCLAEGAERFRWREKRGSFTNRGRIRRGIGVAASAHKNGMFGMFPERSSMILKMNEDGTFTLNTGLHEMGCGTVTSIKMIVAEVLGTDPNRISVTEADTDYGPFDLGSYGSRVTYVCGTAAYHTAVRMKEKLREYAALVLNCANDSIVFGTEWVRNREKREGNVSFGEIATQCRIAHDIDIEVSHTHCGISNPGVYAAHFAEVEVDTATGMVEVVDYLAAHDIGRAINRVMCEGQILGGVQMGIGHALLERIEINDSGEIQTDSFKSYHMINAPSMPKVEILLIEQGEEHGPFGAKSVGEIALVPVAAAVVNAVNDALGTLLAEIPVTPEKILKALSF